MMRVNFVTLAHPMYMTQYLSSDECEQSKVRSSSIKLILFPLFVLVLTTLEARNHQQQLE